MATLFVGHVKSKGDKLAEAAPLFAMYGRQAENSLQGLDAILEERRRYQEEQDRQADNDKRAKMAGAATALGGWDKLSQDAKNSLPGLYGIDFPRDDAGNVKIDPTAKERLEDMKASFLSDPEMMKKFGPVLMGFQQKAQDPAALELDARKQEQDAADKRSDRGFKYWKEEKADARMRQRFTLEAERHTNALREKGAKDDAPSDFFIDPSGKEVLNREQYNSTVPKDMSIPYRQLSVGELDRWRKMRKDEDDRRWKNVQIKGKDLFHDKVLFEIKSKRNSDLLRQARQEWGMSMTSSGAEAKAHKANAEKYMNALTENIVIGLPKDKDLDPNDEFMAGALGDVPGLVHNAVTRPEILDHIPDDNSTDSDGFEILNDQPVSPGYPSPAFDDSNQPPREGKTKMPESKEDRRQYGRGYDWPYGKDRFKTSGPLDNRFNRDEANWRWDNPYPLKQR